MVQGKNSQDVHGHIHVLHGHFAVNGLHRRAGVLHRGEGFLVDVGGFDGVYLLLEHGYLARGLFQGVFVLLFAFEGGAGGCWVRAISTCISCEIVRPMLPRPLSS